MRLLFVIMLILYGSLMVEAQQYDKVWAMGEPVTTMTFNADTVALGKLQDTATLSFNTIGNICDKSGNFLFYSNGLDVRNRYGDIMPYGDSLSFPSPYYSLQEPLGVASNQGLVILPKPNDGNLYYIFHFTSTDVDLSGAGGYEAKNLYYSIVDMRLDSGRGAVIEKNVPIIQNTLLSASRIAACKHANGRDWWIVKPAWHENIYYTFLLTPDSLYGPFIQQIGPVYGNANELPAYSCFSADGNKYASVTPGSYVVIMDFDRCTGLFSNPDSIYNDDSSPPNPRNSGGVSLGYSPSGRFLYVGFIDKLNQYDMWSPLHDSVRIITDTGEFYQMNIIQPAPNGKMYISCWDGGSYKIHVINEPDSLGLACDFRFLGQPVLSANPSSLPYFPNFRMGPLVGSGCDTLTGIGPQTADGSFMKIRPNPATDIIVISFPDTHRGSSMAIYDALGREVYSSASFSSEMSVYTRGFSSGIYSVRVTSGDGQMVGRFVRE